MTSTAIPIQTSQVPRLVATPRTRSTTPTMIRRSQLGMVDPFVLIADPGSGGARAVRRREGTLPGSTGFGALNAKLRATHRLLRGHGFMTLLRSLTCSFTAD